MMRAAMHLIAEEDVRRSKLNLTICAPLQNAEDASPHKQYRYSASG
jgi:hypothetical protein